MVEVAGAAACHSLPLRETSSSSSNSAVCGRERRCGPVACLSLPLREKISAVCSRGEWPSQPHALRFRCARLARRSGVVGGSICMPLTSLARAYFHFNLNLNFIDLRSAFAGVTLFSKGDSGCCCAGKNWEYSFFCLLYTSPSPRD